MNIIELLMRQHGVVKDVLGRMIAEDDKKECRLLLEELSRTLRVHMQIEERAVYIAATRAFHGDEDDEESVLEAYEEHAVLLRCLETLEKTSPTDKRWVVRAKVLQGIFETHVEEEEEELLPELEGKLGQGGLEKLGEQVTRRMSELVANAEEARSASIAPPKPRARGTGAGRGPKPSGSRRAATGAAAVYSGAAPRPRSATSRAKV